MIYFWNVSFFQKKINNPFWEVTVYNHNHNYHNNNVNNRASEGADLGRRRVGLHVLDAGRNLSGVCGWYLVVKVLHRFFIATSRAVVDDDGSAGTALHPLVCSAGGLPKRRRVVHAVRDAALPPGPGCCSYFRYC